MTYGDNIQEARAALADILNHTPPGDSYDIAGSRDMAVRGLAEILRSITDGADLGGLSAPATREGAIVELPVLVLRDRLSNAAAGLPATDPTTTLGSIDDGIGSDWQRAAKHITLAAADLRADTSWRDQAAQRWVIAKDAADLSRAVTAADMRQPNQRDRIPGCALIAVAANAARMQARQGTLDFSVDLVGPDALGVGPQQHPGLDAAIRAQRETARQLNEIPTYRNLKQILKTQADVSDHCAQLLRTGVGNRAYATFHEQRLAMYEEAFRQLRQINGNIGRGANAVAASTHAAAILSEFLPLIPLTAAQRNQAVGLTVACRDVDRAASNAILAGLTNGIYLVPAERPEDSVVVAWRGHRGIARPEYESSRTTWVRAEPSTHIPLGEVAKLFGDTSVNPLPASTQGRPRGVLPNHETPRDLLDEALSGSRGPTRPLHPNSR